VDETPRQRCAHAVDQARGRGLGAGQCLFVQRNAGRFGANAQIHAQPFTQALILRVIDSMQLTAKHRVATPVNWKQGEDVIIVPAVSNDEVKTLYPDGWRQIKPYLRLVSQPGKV
jgi:hypothetical protein